MIGTYGCLNRMRVLTTYKTRDGLAADQVFWPGTDGDHYLWSMIWNRQAPEVSTNPNPGCRAGVPTRPLTSFTSSSLSGTSPAVSSARTNLGSRRWTTSDHRASAAQAASSWTHNLIRKVGGTYKYYVTEPGRAVITTGLKLKELVLIPELGRALA